MAIFTNSQVNYYKFNITVFVTNG